jgi:hypothetical protein
MANVSSCRSDVVGCRRLGRGVVECVDLHVRGRLSFVQLPLGLGCNGIDRALCALCGRWRDLHTFLCVLYSAAFSDGERL